MKISSFLFLDLILSISCFEKYDLNDFMKKLEERNSAQPEFIQATREQEKL
jgi:hypothetical protein